VPISFREYSETLEAGDKELLAKLEERPYQAYSLPELLPALTKPDLLYDLIRILALQAQLNRLLGKGLIKSKLLRGTTYYVSSKAR